MYNSASRSLRRGLAGGFSSLRLCGYCHVHKEMGAEALRSRAKVMFSKDWCHANRWPSHLQSEAHVTIGLAGP